MNYHRECMGFFEYVRLGFQTLTRFCTFVKHVLSHGTQINLHAAYAALAQRLCGVLA